MAALKRPEPQSGPGFRLSVAQAFQNAHAMPQINGLERFQLSDLDSLDVAIDEFFRLQDVSQFETYASSYKAEGVLADDMEAVDLLKTCLSSLETVDSSLHGRIACWLLALHSHQYDTLDDQLALIQQRALLLAEHHYEQCLNIFLSLLTKQPIALSVLRWIAGLIHIMTSSLCFAEMDDVATTTVLAARGSIERSQAVKQLLDVLHDTLMEQELPVGQLSVILHRLTLLHLGGLGSLAKRKAALRSHHKLKVTQAQIDDYIAQAEGRFQVIWDSTRRQFVYPASVIEGLSILKAHLHQPLSRAQLATPLHHPGSQDTLDPNTSFCCGPSETLYTSLWAHLQQHVMEDPSGATSPPAVWLKDLYEDATDCALMNENKELLLRTQARLRHVVMRNVSQTLLLLAKHWKVNHVLQFEGLALCLAEARVVPLTLRMFNIKLDAYLTDPTDLQQDMFLARLWGCHQSAPLSQYPPLRCTRPVEATEPVDTSQDAEPADGPEELMFSYRNMATMAALATILQKTVKNKPARLFSVIVAKGAVILKRCARVQQHDFKTQIYKLFKGLIPYQGRGWRKANMHLLTDIDRCLRHRINDDWFYVNHDTNLTRDYEQAEVELARQIAEFNHKRYQTKGGAGILEQIMRTTDIDDLLKLQVDDEADMARQFVLL